MLATRTQLEQTVAPLSALETRWTLVSGAPVVATVICLTGFYTTAGGEDPGVIPQLPTLIYGLANLGVLGAVYRRVGTDVWRVSALARRPTRGELVAAALATTGGVALGWPATTVLADALDVARYTVPSASSPAALAVLFFGTVLVAPIAEEILFRGLFLGILLERGYAPVIAGGSSLLVFAMLHVFTAGVAGVINALVLGAVLTWLRLRFDNLVGAWLMHLLNNLLEFLIVVSLLPSPYAL